MGDPPNSVDKARTEPATIKTLDAWLLELKLEVKKLREELTTKDNTIKQLNERLIKIERTSDDGGGGSGLSPGSPLTNSLFDGKTSEADVQVLARVHREINKTKPIKVNMIVGGLPSAVGDTDAKKAAHENTSVKNLVGKLGAPPREIRSHKRIKVNGKPDLVVIEFADGSTRGMALRGTKRLKEEAKYNGVYVNRDMTKVERMIEKRLRDERKKLNEELTEKGLGGRPRGRFKDKLFYWGIRSPELKRIFDKQKPEPKE
jgi:hypothetical protein